jgi:hypothetical protein
MLMGPIEEEEPRCTNLYVHAEDILMSLNSHGQELTFSDLEIEEENTVEFGEGEGLALSVMVWESTYGL